MPTLSTHAPQQIKLHHYLSLFYTFPNIIKATEQVFGSLGGRELIMHFITSISTPATQKLTS